MPCQICAGHSLTVLAELRKCGLTDNENCLKMVTLSMNGGDTVSEGPTAEGGGDGELVRHRDLEDTGPSAVLRPHGPQS